MFALKIKSTDWESNKVQVLFVVYSLALLGTFGGLGVGLIVLSYVLLSVVQWLVNKV
jgi:CDP-diacylglycerol--serine O-phosphatidyltransferase